MVDSSATENSATDTGSTARALAEFKRYFGERGWDMRCIEIPEHNYIRFTDDTTAVLWIGFNVAWNLMEQPTTPAVPSQNDTGSMDADEKGE